MKNILITGSKGLVGSACMKLFAEKGFNVFGIDNNGRSKFFGTPSKPIFSDVDTHQQNMDIRNQVDMEDLFSGMKWDIVIHAAAQPSHDYATTHVLEDFHTNASGTVNLLECLRQTNSEGIFVYISTDKVYGENMRLARNEKLSLIEAETRYEPDHEYISGGYPGDLNENGFRENLGLDFAGDRSFFGCSKAAADIYVQQYGARGMKTVCFRPGCISGKNHAGAEEHGFLAYLAKCIKDEKTYKIFGNGKNVRDQIHANDFASLVYAFCENPRLSAVYNVGGGTERSISILEAGQALSKAIGKPFLHEFHEPRKGDRLYDVHNVSKFKEDYREWKYEYSLQDIISELAEE